MHGHLLTDMNVVTSTQNPLLLEEDWLPKGLPSVRTIVANGEFVGYSQTECVTASGVSNPLYVDSCDLAHHLGPTPEPKQRECIIQVTKHEGSRTLKGSSIKDVGVTSPFNL